METQVAPPDENAGPEIEAVYALFLSIAFVLVILRFYVRARMVKKLWWDDFFLLLGLLLSIIAFGLTVARVNSGFGRHAYYLSSQQISFTMKLELIAIVVSIISGMVTKISIGLFLLRIFMSNRVWKRVMYIIIALVVVTSLSATIIGFFPCKPIAKIWDATIKGTCWPQETRIGIYSYQGGTAIFTDILLALLPAYFLKDIQISFRTKLSICALMSLGVFTGICAINRIKVSTSSADSSDVTYSSRIFGIWMGLEINVATIAAAIPALRPLWAKSVRRNLKSSRQARRPASERRLKPSYDVIDQYSEATSFASRLETRVTAQGGENQEGVRSEATTLPNSTGIVKTSDISMENFQKVDVKWNPENSSLSDRERSAEDVV